MKKTEYMIHKMQDVKIKDILSVFLLVIAKCISPFAWKKYKGCWLVCEDPKEARDNGYWFFKYIRENHPEVQSVYAISKKSYDYEKVSELGETVAYGSLKHWVLYLICEYNISSQKGGKPNAAVCAFFELIGRSKVKNVFLQHGVIINDTRWLYADRSDIKYFITSAGPETDFISEKFGYPEGTVQCTGLPRFDNLHDHGTVDNRILIMPSWRAWFQQKTAQESNQDSDFAHSEYLRKWKGLLSNLRMKEIINQYQLEVIFYPHRNMQSYLKYFADCDSGVVIASSEEYDVQELMKTSEMMITDYSSVFFDMVYMKKPVIFYQFDEEKFRSQQYREGWFDYHNNPFGQSFKEENGVLDEIVRIVENKFQVSQQFIAEHRKIFTLFDARNSERIFSLLSNRESCNDGSL